MCPRPHGDVEQRNSLVLFIWLLLCLFSSTLPYASVLNTAALTFSCFGQGTNVVDEEELRRPDPSFTTVSSKVTVPGNAC